MRIVAGLAAALALSTVACEDRAAPREPLTGASPLVAVMHEAAREHDVPAELLAGVAWSETALNDHSRHWTAEVAGHSHGPRSAGVMGLPEFGAVRSVERAAKLLGVDAETIVFDPRANIRGAA